MKFTGMFIPRIIHWDTMIFEVISSQSIILCWCHWATEPSWQHAPPAFSISWVQISPWRWAILTKISSVPPVKLWYSKWKLFMSILSISSLMTLPQNIWHCWVAPERLQWSDWMHGTSLTFITTLSSPRGTRGSRLCVQLVTEVQLAKIHHYHNRILITEYSTNIIQGPQISSTKSHDFRSFWKQKQKSYS
jgi:hypothetical protein